MATPLILDDSVRKQIRELIALAQANPVQMDGLLHRLTNPEYKAKHMAQMTNQTIPIPLAFFVTYSIEQGHPIGTCRHLSMSVQRQGRVPSPEAVWMVAEEFGFRNSLKQCQVWQEKLQGHGIAINIAQPLQELNQS